MDNDRATLSFGLDVAGGVNGGWEDEDTETIVPWLACFLVCLVLAWLGWFFRHRILDAIERTKANHPTHPPPRVVINPDDPGRLAPHPLPCTHRHRRIQHPPSCRRPQAPEEIHWQWVSTGKPPTPVREFRGRSKTIVSSNFRTRLFSLRSDKTWRSQVSTSASVDSVRFSIGGFDTPSYCSSNVHSLSIPPQSLQSQKGGGQKLSNHKFKVLLGRICSITDPEIKREIFELTFEIIQLGTWLDDEWKTFVQKLFSRHPDGPKFAVDLYHDLNFRGLKFCEIARSTMNRWLSRLGIEGADMKEIYEAFECCDKLDIAHNAAVNVVLALRHKLGRSTSDCVDPFSEVEETPTASLEASAPWGDADRSLSSPGGDADRSVSPPGEESDRSLSLAEPNYKTHPSGEGITEVQNDSIQLRSGRQQARKLDHVHFDKGHQRTVTNPCPRQYSIDSSLGYDAEQLQTLATESL